ncbi:hypothetical protein [Salmonirosea aquatica]|uniref:Uncharacterized protein n=1 Tax=Salmonirosea aquatica TaxID=2654236 RepID=A0A7C9BSG3_9BACT|nr:hypothetical protein [Cytophagaceae bacterium SJW1-29]
MENQQHKDEETQKILDDVAATGRNSNDDFNEGEVDDYGIDKSQPDADDELEERDILKGGAGTQSGDRNRNDDFAE